MRRGKKTSSKYKKVVSEQFPINPKRGGGILKIEAWENKQGEVIKYSMAYINPLIFSGDNGRVTGYDNAHGFHHKHYFGELSEVSDFSSYLNLVEHFEQEVKEFLK